MMRTIDQSRFDAIDELLDELLDADSKERECLLAARCGGDRDLRREVESLLAALGTKNDFIEAPGFVGARAVIGDEDDFVGTKIGVYEIRRLIGRGGMSAVYLASRIDDFEKEVAIKIVPPFGRTSGSEVNFRRERQILARLAHPSIAQILDGGTTDGNRPFIVMEFINGKPLDAYCRDTGLTESEMLELFLDVCGAVSFAHRNLIVHRDLKPGNILIDGDGRAKLLDFGIAKLIGNEASDAPTFLGNAMTFEYASPEQITGGSISVATDVYGLGVVLYELVHGKRPFDLRDRPLAEITETITRRRPEFPTPFGEIDLIIDKALAKSPEDRYRSVADLASDIRNYLDSKPISVRPATAFYRFRKYIVRRRFETAAAALFFLVLLGWLGTAIWQTRKARNQAADNRRAAYSAEMILAANEYENANLNRLREILEKYVPKGDEPDLRGFEWHFLNGRLNPPSRIASFPHPDEIWSAEFSPDGRRVATVCNDNRTRVWNLADGSFIWTAEQKGAWKAAFFPDGKRFAVTSSSTTNPVVTIYDSLTAAEIFSIRAHSKRIRGLAVSPDGSMIATGSQDGSVAVWNAESGAEIRRFQFSKPDKGTEFHDLSFSPDGTRLAASGFESLAIIDVGTWKVRQPEISQLRSRNLILNGWRVAFSPSGKTIALGMYDGSVVFLDTATLNILRVLKIHQSNVKSVAFSGDGKILATASWDRTVKFVDVESGEVVNQLRGHFEGVHEIAFSPDGSKLLSASADFGLNLWNSADVASNDAVLTEANLSAFDPATGQLFVLNNLSETVSGWDLGRRTRLWSTQTTKRAFSMDVSNDGQTIAIGESDGGLILFDVASRSRTARYESHGRALHAIEFSPDGRRIFAGYEDGMLTATETASGKALFSVRAHDGLIKALAVSPDGKTLATGGNDKRVKLIDAGSGETLSVIGDFTKPLYRTFFSADGRLLLATGADSFAEVRGTDGQIKQRLTGLSGGVFAAAFSPDGKRIATASEVGIIRLWNVETGDQVLAFTAGQRQLVNLWFSADGNTLVSIDTTGKTNSWRGGSADQSSAK